MNRKPTKYWISTLSSNTPLKALVKIAKQRWIIERDYQELKQELGLGHFEGRNWRGFHHHATLFRTNFRRSKFQKQTSTPGC